MGDLLRIDYESPDDGTVCSDGEPKKEKEYPDWIGIHRLKKFPENVTDEKIYGKFPPENASKPWLKDGDFTYLSDAKDPRYVLFWPYRTYEITLRIAPPYKDFEDEYVERFPVVFGNLTGRRPEDFRMLSVINPYCPEDWEDDDDPLYIHIMIEGDLRVIDMKGWVAASEKAFEIMANMRPSMIMTFYIGLHTKRAPDLKRPDLYPTARRKWPL